MLFLSAKLRFYHNILNNHMLIQCADLIFKQHDRKLQQPNVYHRVLFYWRWIMESSWITRREIRTQTNPYLVTDTIRGVWSGTSSDIPRFFPSVHTFVTHALPANRMFSGFKSLAENEWWNSDESRHIPKLEMRHSRRFSITNRTCHHKFPGSIYGS